ncbi:hypothetical protein B0T24DRAFT_674046 [Lasiosphaeria ovina]|uniref:Uncharacterized protein n=1 Tax=Lasiosphaeria ovina TaxID=92902 RepID=A0AAE0TYI9_9PEZI|nr:hypothetical protein B0T24DRAFT_674046 [Lasiosphaeria ovina]
MPRSASFKAASKAVGNVSNTLGEAAIVITVQKLSTYPDGTGTGGVLAGPMESDVNASSHRPDGIHTIDVHLVSLLSGYDKKSLYPWARTGNFFIEAVWGFPGHSYPVWTTKHLLTLEGAAISFQGGFGSFTRLFDHVKGFQTSSAASSIPRAPSRPRSYFPTYQGSQKLPLRDAVYSGDLRQANEWSWLEPRPESYRSLNYEPLDSPPPMSPTPTDDDSSCYSESVSTPFADLDEDYLSPVPSRYSNSRHTFTGPKYSSDVWTDQQAQQQLHAETLERQRKDAEELYRRSGNTQGLLDVVNSAAQFRGAFHPSGMPLF